MPLCYPYSTYQQPLVSADHAILMKFMKVKVGIKMFILNCFKTFLEDRAQKAALWTSFLQYETKLQKA